MKLGSSLSMGAKRTHDAWSSEGSEAGFALARAIAALSEEDASAWLASRPRSTAARGRALTESVPLFSEGDSSAFLDWLTSQVGSCSGGGSSTALQPSTTCPLQCNYPNARTARALAAAVGNALIEDITALKDVCARQPKPPTVAQLLSRGPAWWNSIIVSLWGPRAPSSSEFDIQLWLGPTPKSANDSYTLCGELGSSGLSSSNNAPLLRGLNNQNLKILAGMQEAGSSPLMGTTTFLNWEAYWENKELAHISNETGAPSGLIWPRSHMLVAYRQDWFDQLGVAPPTTWAEMISLAYALSALPDFHTTMYNPADPLDSGPSMDITWHGHDAGSWPEEGSTPTQAELLTEGVTPSNDALKKRWPLCLDLGPYCKSGDILAAIAASMLQVNGTTQNPYLDPLSLMPYTSGIGAAGWAAALQIHRALTLLATPNVDGLRNVSFASCAAFNRAFALGACAMTIEWEGALPFLYAYPGIVETGEVGRPQDVPGNVGWAPLPGSSYVVDRTTGRLTPCTATLCHHSHRERVRTYTLSGGPPSAGAASSNSSTDVPPYPLLTAKSLEDAGVVRTDKVEQVSRAPFSAQAFTLFAQSCNDNGVSVDEVVAIKTALGLGPVPMFGTREALSGALKNAYFAAKAAGYFSSPYFPQATAPMSPSPPSSTNKTTSTPAAAGHRLRKLSQGTGAAVVSPPPPGTPAASPPPPPVDTEVDTPPPIPSFDADLATWAAPVLALANSSGIHPDDSRRMLAASWRARHQFTNQVVQIVLPSEVGPYFRMAYDEALIYWYNTTGATTTSTLSRLTQRLSALVAVSATGVRTVLYASTGYVPPIIPPPSGPAAQSSGRSSVNLAAAIATPLVVSSVLIVATIATVMYLRSLQQHRTLMGAVRPPKGAPGTTIVLTDIQDSTDIWEALPAEVVDEAVALHHATIRRLAAQHGGYEWGTEGDSFFLAFHRASDAAVFGVQLQVELLHADWPQELLAYSLCHPVYVAPAASLPPMRPPRSNSRLRGLNARPTSSAQVGDDDLVLKSARDETIEKARTSAGTLSGVIGVLGGKKALASDPAGRDSWARGSGSPHDVWGLYGQAFSKRMTDRDLGRDLNRTLGSGQVIDTMNESNSGTRPILLGEQLALLTPILPSGPSAVDEALMTHVSPYSSMVPATDGSGMVSLVISPNPSAVHEIDRDKVVVFRGLRVRMGCASVTPDCGVDVQASDSAGRTRYGGACVAAAKAVQDGAPGGMVLAAASTFSQLAAEAVPRPGVIIMHMGEHVLTEVAPAPQALYQIIPQDLMQRIPHLASVRSERIASLGALYAPCNEAAVCFMHAVGVASLGLSDHALASQAITIYHATAQACLMEAGGYLVEAADGLVLTAFTRPARAIRWALDTIAACLSAEWPEDLLSHEAGEVVALTTVAAQEEPGSGNTGSNGLNANGGPGVDVNGAAERMGGRRRRPQSLRPTTVQQLLFRGLRLKCGIDFGPVKTDIEVSTARVGMRGRVLNRAARVAGVAKSGQVVSTLKSWDMAAADMADQLVVVSQDGSPPTEREVIGTPLGSHRLKGLSEELELVQCFYPSAMTMGNVMTPFAIGVVGGGATPAGITTPTRT